MAKQTDEIVPGEVSQAQWDAKYDTTTKALKDMGGADAKDSDDLPEGAANKYDTGVPPADTDELSEGAANKYDTGVPPADLEALPDGATRKAMTDTEKTKLTGIEAGADVNPTGPEIRDLVVAITETERKIVITDPQTGEFKLLAIHRNAAGNLEYDYEDVAES